MNKVNSLDFRRSSGNRSRVEWPRHRRFLGKPVVSVTSKPSAYSPSSAVLENWGGCKGVGRKDMGFYLWSGAGVDRLFQKGLESK